jgi:hypothetical protein
MIRFRNPISDIRILIENFKMIYAEFSDFEFFTLDNIAEFFARENLASSSGYTGDEALKRSYLIKDDSRKSMKMQAKSYSELYRILGWITSYEKNLNFRFTFLGVHLALSGDDSSLLYEECLLGIIFPNNILKVKFGDINKPFLNILSFAEKLEGRIIRDEIIIGPMNLSNGFLDKEINDKVEIIKNLRKSGRIENINDEIAKIAAFNKMEVNSVRNLTRFVISSIVYVGWFEKQSQFLYGNRKELLFLTEKGYKKAESLRKIRNIDGNTLEPNSKFAKQVSYISLLQMFCRSGYQVKEEVLEFERRKDYLKDSLQGIEFLFSPFQFFSKNELDIVLSDLKVKEGKESRSVLIENELETSKLSTKFSINPNKTQKLKRDKDKETILKKIKSKSPNVEDAISLFLDEVIKMNQIDFYPLVGSMLSHVFNRRTIASTVGNNNQRYDLLIFDEKFSIPVEIKSPTEELFLSVKAIRQAIENKVILLARKSYNTRFEISTFACGYRLPNERSEVYKLIEEVYEVLKINIAILDIETLTRAFIYCSESNNYYDISSFANKRGIIDFNNENI